ncbi:hypothetical protein P43SY_003769 [Pythium insidiosum]|uniref:Uncharacterized protein n=1 Tax=Pythium insidiosum TaxID=114742 RepID=A0AAD5Q2A0_PYTIN|nr:hypothetical protein P43SY_003769 [Pythium insidiosum]
MTRMQRKLQHVAAAYIHGANGCEAKQHKSFSSGGACSSDDSKRGAATKRRDNERDRAHRFRAWLDTRRAKADELLQSRLSEWELRKRFEIRMELERELELERRAHARERHSNGNQAVSC